MISPIFVSWTIPEFTERFAGSLLHSLWQDAAIAILAAIVLRLLARRPAELRYAVAIAALAVMLAAPVATFFLYRETGALAGKLWAWTGGTIAAASPAERTEWAGRIVAAWCAGYAVLTIRLVAGWRLSRRLAQTASAAMPESVVELFEQLRQRLVPSAPVRVLAHARIDTPMVVGWLRPVVLLPIAALSGLTESQLFAVLAHELAHIRRHDFVTNFLQRLVESVLFYHPAVWWLSGRIRAERENCCDDLAVRVSGDRRVYIEALVVLERRRLTSPSVAVAAVGDSLRERAERLLGLPPSRADWQPAVAAVLFVLAWGIAGMWQSTSFEAQALPTSKAAIASPVTTKATVPAPEFSAAASAVRAIAAIVTASPALAAPQAATGVMAGQEKQVASPEISDVIEGRVTQPSTGEGVSDVKVTLLSDGRDPLGFRDPGLVWTTKTDIAGRFIFKNVAPGVYEIRAERDGFLGVTGFFLDYPQLVAKNAGQPISDYEIYFLREGVIAGRVLDPDGRPLDKCDVAAYRIGYSKGRRVLIPNGGRNTDNRGEYRFFGLTPGTYLLSANGRDGARGGCGERAVKTFLGGTRDAALSTPVIVPEGGDVQGMDIQLRLGATAKVSGRIVNPFAGADGQPTASSQTLALVKWNDTNSLDRERVNLTVQNKATAKGLFEIENVPPGSYNLWAMARDGSGLAAFGSVRIEVGDRDLDDVTIAIKPGTTVKVRVTVDGGPPRSSVAAQQQVSPELARYLGQGARGGPQSAETPGTPKPPVMRPTIQVRLSPRDFPVNASNNPSSLLSIEYNNPGNRDPAYDPDGVYTFPHVPEGQYTLDVSSLPGKGYVEDIRLAGRNVVGEDFAIAGSEVSIHVVIGTNSGSVGGTVVNLEGRPVRNAVVALVPQGAKRGNLAFHRLGRSSNGYESTGRGVGGGYQVVPTPEGSYTIGSIPPGEYELFAWIDDKSLPEGAWQRAEFMAQFEGKSVTVVSGQTVVNNLTVISIPRN